MSLRRAQNKFKAKAVVVDGIRFQSTLEAKYYCELKLRQKAGEVLYFLRQIPFHLPGGVKYVADFAEFHKDGTVHYVDVKGYLTDTFKIKRKMVEALYPVEIEIKTKGIR